MILVAIDWFSKGTSHGPVLFNQDFHNYGLLEDIVSDHGSQFTSRVWKAFCTQLWINVSLNSIATVTPPPKEHFLFFLSHLSGMRTQPQNTDLHERSKMIVYCILCFRLMIVFRFSWYRARVWSFQFPIHDCHWGNNLCTWILINQESVNNL